MRQEELLHAATTSAKRKKDTCRWRLIVVNQAGQAKNIGNWEGIDDILATDAYITALNDKKYAGMSIVLFDTKRQGMHFCRNGRG